MGVKRIVPNLLATDTHVSQEFYADKASTKRSAAAGASMSKRPTLPIYRSPRRSGCASSTQSTATTAANSSPGKA
jgi:hypothetical protein